VGPVVEGEAGVLRRPEKKGKKQDRKRRRKKEK
jgi:hypothetical protein